MSDEVPAGDAATVAGEPAADVAAQAAARRRAWRRRVFSRRAAGRAVMIASVAAAIIALIGGIVAWQLVGTLRSRSVGTLRLLDRSLVNVQDSLVVAADVMSTVGSSFATIEKTLDTVHRSVGDASTTLQTVAELTESIPPNLDNVDTALGKFSDAAAVVDKAVGSIGSLPLLDSFNSDLSGAIDDVRDTLKPIATSMRSSTTSIRGLSTSSVELQDQLDTLRADLAEMAGSVEQSQQIIERYRDDTDSARALTTDSLAEIDRQMLLSRILVVVLALTIAVGQIAPYRIGRQMFEGI